MADGPEELPVERAALIVLDGWGLADPGPGNAVDLAKTPVFDELWGCPRVRWATRRSVTSTSARARS